MHLFWLNPEGHLLPGFKFDFQGSGDFNWFEDVN